MGDWADEMENKAMDEYEKAMPDTPTPVTHADMEERLCFFMLGQYGIRVEQDSLGFWNIQKDGVPIKDTWPLTDEHLQVNCFDGRYEAIPYAFMAALATARGQADDS